MNETRPGEQRNDSYGSRVSAPGSSYSTSASVDHQRRPQASTQGSNSYRSHGGHAEVARRERPARQNISGPASGPFDGGAARTPPAHSGSRPVWAMGGVFPKQHTTQGRAQHSPSLSHEGASQRGPAARRRAGSEVPSQSDQPSLQQQRTDSPASSYRDRVVRGDDDAEEEEADVTEQEREHEQGGAVKAADKIDEPTSVHSPSLGDGVSRTETSASSSQAVRTDEGSDKHGSSARGRHPSLTLSAISHKPVPPSRRTTQTSTHPSVREERDDASVRTTQTSTTQRTQTTSGGGADRQGQLGGGLPSKPEQWFDLTHQQAEEISPPVRNSWSQIRWVLREPFAEFVGMLLLLVIGTGSDCQTRISQQTYGDYSTQSFSWGFGVMLGIYIAGGISGGHLNPAITVMLAVFRGFPWRLVPRYIVGQVAGAFCGSALIYANYRNTIRVYDPDFTVVATASQPNSSAQLFVTMPNHAVAGTAGGFGQEVLATAVLVIVVLALGDENNAPPGAGLGALIIGFAITAIAMSMGWLSGYAINCARDFGPRLMLSAAGYPSQLWTHDAWWWLSGAICGPICGGLVGAAVYDVFVFAGDGSPVNYFSQDLVNAILAIPRTLKQIQSLIWHRRRVTSDDESSLGGRSSRTQVEPDVEKRATATPQGEQDAPRAEAAEREHLRAIWKQARRKHDPAYARSHEANIGGRWKAAQQKRVREQHAQREQSATARQRGPVAALETMRTRLQEQEQQRGE